MKLRKIVVRTVGWSALPLLAVTSAPAGPAVTEVPEIQSAPAKEPRSVHLTASKRHGFAPMTVNLTGLMQSVEGELLPLAGSKEIRLVIESPFLRVQSSHESSLLYADMHYEALSWGPETPGAFWREIQLNKPGLYAFRIQVIDEEGGVVSSNEVTVRAL